MATNKPRREPKRIELATRGIVATVVVLLLLGFTYLRSTGAIGGDPEVTAEVNNAGGSLRSGADVKISGVVVGRVTDIEGTSRGTINVGLAIQPDQLDEIPANVVARILPATVFGTSFVDLVVNDAPSAQKLEKGATVPADKTQETLELQQALDDIDDLVKALGPAELQSAIYSAATALKGRGAQIGHIIDVTDNYLAKLTPQLPLVRNDLRKLADNMELINQIAPDLLDAVDDGLTTAQLIVQQSSAISAIVTDGVRLAQTADGFMKDNIVPAENLLSDGEALLNTLYAYRHLGITGGLQTNLTLSKKLPEAIDGGFLAADSPVTTVPPPFYTAGDRPDFGGGARGRAATPNATFRAMAGGR